MICSTATVNTFARGRLGMAFIERCSEAARLRELYAGSSRGGARVLLVEGPVASGKTELLQDLEEHVTRRGGLVLTAAAPCTQPPAAFDVVDGLVRAARLAPSPSVRTPAPPAAALRVPAARSAPVACGPAQRVGGEGGLASSRGSAVQPASAAAVLSALLRERCAAQPVLVTVDDLQLADPRSVEALAAAVRRLPGARLLVVTAERDASAHPAAGRAALLAVPGCQRLALPLLPPSGVRTALTTAVGGTGAARLAAAYHAASGGHPLLLQGLVEDGAAVAPDGPGTLPARPVAGGFFRQAVLGCLYRWDAATVETARGLAVLGRGAPPDEVARLTGLPAGRVRQALAALSGSALLEGGWFRAPAVHRAVLDSLVGAQRARLHLAAARMLRADGRPASQVARHLVKAGPVGERWAVVVLRRAAEEAAERGRREVQREFLEAAYHGCEDASERAALAVELMRLLLRDRPSDAARWLEPLRQDLAAGRLESRHRPFLVRCLLWLGRGGEPLETYRRLLVPGSEAAAASGLRLPPPWLEPSVDAPGRGGGGAGARTSRLGGPVGTSAPEPAWDGGGPTRGGLSAAEALGSVLYERSGGSAVARAERLLGGLAPSEGTVSGLLTALHVLLHADRADRVEHWCRVLMERPEVMRVPAWRGRVAALRAEAALRADRPDGVQRWSAEALAALAAEDWGVLVGVPLSVLLRARTALGRREAALGEPADRPGLPDEVRKGRWAALFLRARGHWLLEAGRPRAALADFRGCAELAAGWGVELPALVPWRSDCALALARLGDRAGARALAEEQLRMRGGRAPRVRGVGLRALAATARGSERISPLREAAGLLREAGDAVELLPVLADLSAVYRAVGDAEAAGACERQLLRAVAECGCADGAAASAEPAGDGFGVRHGGHPAEGLLSAAEQRVAQLAARGHTNRQISHLLHITVSTVEQHLTRVYRKLRVTRRAELPSWLGEGGPSARPAVGVPAQRADRLLSPLRRPHPAGAPVHGPNG